MGGIYFIGKFIAQLISWICDCMLTIDPFKNRNGRLETCCYIVNYLGIIKLFFLGSTKLTMDP